MASTLNPLTEQIQAEAEERLWRDFERQRMARDNELCGYVPAPEEDDESD